MVDEPLRLTDPEPPLSDGTVVLRRWAADEVGCVEEASRDPRIPEGTTVPAIFSPAEGLAWIERQGDAPRTARGCRWLGSLLPADLA